MKAGNWIGRNTWVWAVLGSLLLWVLIGLISGHIALQTVLYNATLASFLVLLGFGQMTVITSGDGAIDLTMPYIVTLSAFISTSIMEGGNPYIIPGLLAALLVSVAIGCINGIVITKLRVPPIITTLATGYITFSGVLVYSRHTPGVPNNVLSQFVKFQYMGISSLMIISLLLSFIVAVILYKTPFGKRIHAMGQSSRAAQKAGIRTERMTVFIFMFSAFLAGLTGVLLGAYIGGAFMDMGNAYLLTSIAAVLVGGTLVSGGKSSVAGTLGGALLLTLLVTFLNLTKLTAGYQYIIQGAALILILTASKSRQSAR
ncbi:ABC transporter permease [Paenibacillus hamazuiensis]|uniref:ABC transporter permease n=1 Tax=Paenibacillus hamazuiensis TaxID=2936508 RepID=UPI002010C307|nr:ABC transporter permease [Paenibacillus hamazuiensis]